MKKKTPTRGAFFTESTKSCRGFSDKAKIGISFQREKDLLRVLDYFRYTIATTLDCALATGILRNSITWYVHDLERLGLIQAVKKAKDDTTGFLAKHYSADPKLWHKPKWVQGDLFPEQKGGMS